MQNRNFEKLKVQVLILLAYNGQGEDNAPEMDLLIDEEIPTCKVLKLDRIPKMTRNARNR